MNRWLLYYSHSHSTKKNFTACITLLKAFCNTSRTNFGHITQLLNVLRNWKHSLDILHECLNITVVKKNSFLPKFGQKLPKWSQNRVFEIFWKKLSLVFAGNNLKWKLITNIAIDISPPIPYLAKFWFSSNGPTYC